MVEIGNVICNNLIVGVAVGLGLGPVGGLEV